MMKAENEVIMRQFEEGSRHVPADLRAWCSPRQLVQFTLEAAQEASFPAGPFAGHSPKMILSVLAYCYAVGIQGSHEVEEAQVQDASVRYLCARNAIASEVLRQFRRHYPQEIRSALAALLERAFEHRNGTGPQEAGPGPEALGREAARRLHRAAFLDTVALDEEN